MEAIAILGVAAAIVWLILWAIRNEDASSIGEQKGLFKMVDHEREERAETTGSAPPDRGA